MSLPHLKYAKKLSAWSSVYRRWDNGYNFSTSPYLKEKLRKLDELSEQVRYMSKYGIETFDDLYADRDRLRGEMDKLVAYRTKLQNKIRRALPAEKETLRREKSGVTERITELRKQLKLNKGIEERLIKIQEKTDLLYANEYRAKEAEQNRKSQRKEQRERWCIRKWMIDEEAAKVIRRIFALCVDGFGPTQIAKKLKTDKVMTPTEYWNSIGRNCGKPPERPFNWCSATIAD